MLKAWNGENGLVSVDMGPVQMGWQEVPLAREMDTVAVELAAAPGAGGLPFDGQSTCGCVC